MTVRVVLVSHDGLGLGHATRNRRVAERLALDHGAEAVLACGVDLPGPVPFGVEIFRLPALRKVGSGRYESRQLRRSCTDVIRLRSELFESMVGAVGPDVVVVDRHPFGVGRELLGGLDRARAAGARLVLGLRDILDAPERVAREWPPGVIEEIADYYDLVTVYGDREWFDPVGAYGWPRSIAKKVRFAGLVGAGVSAAPIPWRRADDDRPFMVAAVGSGFDGYPLIDAFLRAAAERDWRGLAAAGPHMPEDARRMLEPLAEQAGIRLVAFERDLPAWLASADLAVTMAGANTVAEVLEAGCRSIVVPRSKHRQEQKLRASALERMGRSMVLAPEDLTPQTLRDAVDIALATAAPAAMELRGAAMAASLIVELAGSQ